MDADFEKYLREFLEKKYNINPEGIYFDSVSNFDPVWKQLEDRKIDIPDIMLNQLKFNLETMFDFHKKEIYLYKPDYKETADKYSEEKDKWVISCDKGVMLLENYMKRFSHDEDVLNKQNCKTADNYSAEKDKWVNTGDKGVMSLENYIERFLHDEDALKAIYKNKSNYVMGNPYPLTEYDYKKKALAEEVIDGIDCYKGTQESELDEKTREVINNIYYRSGGTLDRLNDFLNFDVKAFDKGKYAGEICKIIYFIYEMEYNLIPPMLKGDRTYFNMLEFLSNPSLESADNSILGWENYRGKITLLIKNTLEKEMSLQTIDEMRIAFYNVVSERDRLLKCVHEAMEEKRVKWGRKLDIEVIKRDLELIPNKPYKPVTATKHQSSPITMFYWKVLQYEFIGEMEDMIWVNCIETNAKYDVPEWLVWRMIRLDEDPIKRCCVENHIHYNADLLVEYVYLKKETDEKKYQNKVRKIQNGKGQVATLLDYFISRRPLIDMKNEITTLLIISCLQAILTDKIYNKNETFEYAFYGCDDCMEHKPLPVQGALRKNKRYTVEALKIYWERKVADHLYANQGRYKMKCNFREFENVCYEMMKKIYSSSNISEMLNAQQIYYEKLITIFPTFEK